MNFEPFLRRIGLSEYECKIYLDLLEHGASTISDIGKRVWCHRQIVYRTIPVLVENGLVSSSITGKRKLYNAESPKHLQGVVNSLVGDFSSILPSLEEIHHTQNQTKPVLKFFNGKRGIRFIFDDVMNTLGKWEVFYRYSSRKVSQNASDYLSSNYRKLRDEKKIERMVITSEWVSKLKRPRLERETVTIPVGFDLFEDNIAKIIYAGKVAIIDYNTDTAFIIESPIFANFERKLFQLLFKFLKKEIL